MKSGLLAGFFAMKCLNDLGVKLSGDIYAESVIDEEYGGVNGTIANRIKYPGIDFAILAEPTDLVCGIESRGGTDWKITVTEEGPGGIKLNESSLKNPVYKLGKVVLALEKFEKYLNKNLSIPQNYSKKDKLKVLTYQVASGGTEYLESQAIPLEGHIYLWFYTHEYMDEEQAEAIFLDFMKKELLKYKEFKESFPRFEKVIRYLKGHKTDTKHEALVSIKKAFQILGLPFKASGISGTNDAYVFKNIGRTEVIVLGPKGENLHGIDEYVELESVFSMIKIMVLSAIEYCS